MRHDVRLVCVVALIAACSKEPRRGPDLQITTESVKLKRGEALPEKSAIFDGELVRLRAARGETLTVLVWRRDETPFEVALTLDDRAMTVRGYEVTHQRVVHASTRMYGPSRGAGQYPDKLIATATPAFVATRVAMFEIDCSGHSSSVQGTLRVADQTFAVELKVGQDELPDAPLRVWAYLHPRELERAGIAEADLAWTLRRYGVAASRDLGPDAYEAHAEQLAGLPYVPVLLPKAPEELERDVVSWVHLLAGTGKLPFAIPIDEPRDAATRAEVRALADRVRGVDGAAGKFLFAVTDQPHDVYGDAVDVFITPMGLTRERPASPERWTYNGSPPFAGSMILDTDGVALRTWGWIGWRYRIPLWYVWDATYWSDRHNHRRKGGQGLPEPGNYDLDATTFDDGEDHGALDGMLIYPTGEPSLRLAALRRGLLDRVLLEAVEACAGRPTADAIAATVIPKALGDAGRPGDSGPGSWPTDELAWETARHALLDRLAQCPR